MLSALRPLNSCVPFLITDTLQIEVLSLQYVLVDRLPWFIPEKSHLAVEMETRRHQQRVLK